MYGSRTGTIGSMELLAGVEDRRDFWRQFDPKSYRTTQDYIDDAMSACRRMIARRIVRGELSLLFVDQDIDRQVVRIRRYHERKAIGAAS